MTTEILIVLTGSLGDVARALCLPAHLKKHLPNSRISWLVEEKWRDLISEHPHVDRTIIFRRVWRVGTATDLVSQLRKQAYDISLDLQRIFKSGLMSLASGAKRRIGFHRRNTKEMNWIFSNEQISYQNENLSKLKHYLEFCKHLGLPDPESLDFGLRSPQTFSSPMASLQEPYIAIVVGSSWPTKDWHLQGYHELIEKILTIQRYQVVLLGDQTQIKAAGQLQDLCRSELVINLVGRTSLGNLVSILGKADVVIGPDTGSGHLAAAVGTPYVTLIGPTDADRVAPYGCEHLVVKGDVPCSPCVKKKCAEPQYDCMRAISAAAVFDMLKVALKGSRSERD